MDSDYEPDTNKKCKNKEVKDENNEESGNEVELSRVEGSDDDDDGYSGDYEQYTYQRH
jgi:hypothetical protein